MWGLTKRITGWAAAISLLVPNALVAQAVDRTVLPVVDPFTGTVGMTEDQSVPDFPRPVTAPEGAPNVVLVMTDDIGFSASSTFGGPIPTPNLTKLADMGVIFNRFHTAAMCSPSRAALLTGREPHSVGYGSIGELTMGYPGYWGRVPDSAASIASVLKFNGYSTAMFGKEHNVPHSEDSPAGPFETWPNQRGFEYFYGFIGGAINQFAPTLFENGVPVDLSDRPDDYILDNDLANHAISWVHMQKAAAPEKPFFLYLAPGTAHAPHQAPADWIAKFHGAFDMGWDRLREETLERQIEMGVVPEGTLLTPRPDLLPAWDSLSVDEQRVQARMMEVYAAQIAYLDHEFGRLLAELERMGVAEDTLFLFIQGDNGGPPAGRLTGDLNHAGEMANAVREGVPEKLAMLGLMGGPQTDQIFSATWGWAVNTPFPWMKQVASHLGGTRNPLVVAWPGHVPEGGSVRSQYGYIADIYPTILEAAGLPVPRIVSGVEQQPLGGQSLLYAFNDPDAPSARTEQAYELFATRAIYQDGWLANTERVRVPWYFGPPDRSPADYEWELYYLPDDFSQAVNLAESHPEKLEELKARWHELALEGQMYPVSADFSQRNYADVSNREDRGNSFTYWGGDISVPQTFGPVLGNQSFVIEAELEQAGEQPLDGVVSAVGSHLGGWSFYIHEGRPVAYLSRSVALSDKFRVAGEPLPEGDVTIRWEWSYEGPGRNGAGMMRIFVNGNLAGEGRIERSISSPVPFAETFDTGRDTAASVSPDYERGGRLVGRLMKMTVHVGE